MIFRMLLTPWSNSNFRWWFQSFFLNLCKLFSFGDFLIKIIKITIFTMKTLLSSFIWSTFWLIWAWLFWISFDKNSIFSLCWAFCKIVWTSWSANFWYSSFSSCFSSVYRLSAATSSLNLRSSYRCWWHRIRHQQR